jgi:hypothetical protein
MVYVPVTKAQQPHQSVLLVSTYAKLHSIGAHGITEVINRVLYSAN